MSATTDKYTLGEASFMISVGAVVLPVILAALIIPSAILNAFVLSKLWGWYIAPFFTLPMLDMIHSFGIVLIARFLTAHLDDAERKRPWWFQILVTTFGPLFCLLLGWIGTWWLP